MNINLKQVLFKLTLLFYSFASEGIVFIHSHEINDSDLAVEWVASPSSVCFYAHQGSNQIVSSALYADVEFVFTGEVSLVYSENVYTEFLGFTNNRAPPHC